MRSVVCAGLLCLCWLVVLGCDGVASKAPKHYNIVMVLVDTLRADRMGLYGHERANTPFLSSLEERATVFDRHVANAGCTFPSVNSMLTSRSPDLFLGRAEEVGSSIPDGMPTLASVLAGAGYETFASSSSLVVKDEYDGVMFGGYGQGFDEFEESCREKSARCINKTFFEKLSQFEQPFFAYLHYLEPHSPYQPPPWHERQYAKGKYNIPWVRDGAGHRLWREVEEDPYKYPSDGRVINRFKDLYDDETLYFDAEMKNLFAELEAKELLDETIVILVSDHGEAFLEHARGGHCRDIAYDSNLRVPLMVLLPDDHPLADNSRGLRYQQTTQNLDVAPTVLSLVGLRDAELASAFEGADLSEIWQSGADLNRPVHRYSSGIQGRFRVLRVGRHKLIYDTKDETGELYDVVADPGERVDLAESDGERYGSMVAILIRLLTSEELEATAKDADFVNDELRRMGYL